MRGFNLLFHIGPDGCRGNQASPSNVDGRQLAALHEATYCPAGYLPQLAGGFIE